jgi:TonB-linked SusC/RagA family outer membrane protein
MKRKVYKITSMGLALAIVLVCQPGGQAQTRTAVPLAWHQPSFSGQRSPVPAAPVNANPVDRTVTGKVVSNKGEGLPGVTVLVKGTNAGTTTAADGSFSLAVPDQAGTLVVSFIGYNTREVAIPASGSVNITLEEDAKTLEEVVVVGYSTKQLSQLSSSVAVVSGARLNDVTSNNVSSLLQGKAPGVIVSNASGDPNASSNVVIRGSGSINAGAGPLYVVDGLIGGTANPRDIESVTILKDAAATGLYGSRAANGVVIITTKSGKAGKTRIEVNSTLGYNTANTGKFRVMDSRQLYEYTKSFYPAGRLDQEIPASVLAQNTNWHDLAFRTGFTQNQGLTVSGGTEKTQFYVAGNYYFEEGTLRFNANEQFNVRTNITHRLNDKLKLNLKINGRMSNQDADPAGLDGALYGSYLNMPWDKPYNPDGSVNRGTEGGWYGREQENFLHGWQYNLNNTKGMGVNGDLTLDYTITPDLSFSTYNRIGYANSQNELYQDIRSKAGKGLGRLSNGTNADLSLITSNRLRYGRSFGRHMLEGLAVAEAEKNEMRFNTVLGEGLAPGLHVINTASRILNATGNINENAFTKGLVQLDYNFDNRYFAVGSFINESSSRFGANNRSANFYTLGTSWILSNESFLKDRQQLNLLKVRASYGVTGNANIGNYQSLGLYSFASQYAGNSGSFPYQMANQDLTWEKAKSFNIGLDAGLFNRITLNLDVYDKTTQGLLLNVEKPYTSGFASVISNVGSIQNRGVEINLNTDNLKGPLRWETNFNIALNRSKVLKLDQGKDIRQGNLIIQVGQELYTWNMRKWVGVDPENGDPLWEKVTTDANGTPTVTTTNSYSDATQQNVGAALPDFTGGMSNTLSFKGFSLFAFFNFVSGNLVYHNSRALFDSDGAYYTYNSMALPEDWSRWQQRGDVATHPKPVFGGNKNSNKTSSRYLEDGSYLRLRNVTFSYELPAALLNRLKIASTKVFVSGDNLLTRTRFSGMDPEVTLGPGGGTSSVKYPISRKVLFGINLGF